jgi:CheY-like chemotaxis protein
MSKEPLNILLVEDNEGDILLTQEAFEESKLEVKLNIVRDGEEAIHYLTNSSSNNLRPDIILLDVNLPKLNGHEVLTIIKNNPDLKQIPIIMLTTSSSESDVFKAYANHVNSYVTKPVEVELFLKAVSEIGLYWSEIVRLPYH